MDPTEAIDGGTGGGGSGELTFDETLQLIGEDPSVLAAPALILMLVVLPELASPATDALTL